MFGQCVCVHNFECVSILFHRILYVDQRDSYNHSKHTQPLHLLTSSKKLSLLSDLLLTPHFSTLFAFDLQMTPCSALQFAQDHIRFHDSSSFPSLVFLFDSFVFFSCSACVCVCQQSLSIDGRSRFCNPKNIHFFVINLVCHPQPSRWTSYFD